MQSCLVSTWKEGTRKNYGSHLRRLGFFYGPTPAKETQRVAEEVLLLLFKSGYRPATLRGAVSAVKAVHLLGWIPDLGWHRLWRLARAPVATKGERAYAGPHVLQVMAEACSTPADWSVFAAAAISFACLARVGEVASIRRSGLRSGSVSYWGIKRDERWVSRDVGRYVAEWILWLRKTHAGREVLVGSPSVLEEGMARLLQGSVYASYRWHSWRRAGAAFLRWKGLPWRHLCWWGRWASVRMAHWYAAAPDEFIFHSVSRLPWPTATGVRWNAVAVEDFWPRSLVNLCEPDDRPERSTFAGDKRSRAGENAVTEDSDGDAVPPPSTVSAEPGRAPVGSRPSKVRKRPSVTEPRVPGAVPLAPSPPTRSSVSAAERGPQDSADAPEPHPPARTARSSASKFVGRLRGSATGARPCPKRAVSRLLKPSKPLLVGRPGASRGGPSGLPQGQAMAVSRFRRLEASSAGPSPAPIAAPVIDLTG